MNEALAQTDIHDKVSVEIERIYVRRKFQGQGFGMYLMENVIQIALQKKVLYLVKRMGENEKALQFYQKHGFYQIGTHYFVMGQEKQTDYVLRKDL